LEQLITDHLVRPLGQIDLGSLLRDALAIARRYHLRLPPTLALLAKTLAMCEGIAAQLDPNFEMMAAITPYLPRMLAPEHPKTEERNIRATF
jgi:ubiquinone biosynthesis protein